MKMTQAGNIFQWIKIYCLYQKAFPANERKPFSMITSMQKKGVSDVWFFKDNNEFIGLAITINGKDLILIDYLAISEKKRNLGYGSKILQMLQSHYSDCGLLLEIETVRQDAPNYEERKRRKQFYLNNNMKPMNVFIKLFGVEMELMGYNCHLTFDEYFDFYRTNYGEFITSHISEVK